LHIDGSFVGKSLSPPEAAGVLAEAVGPTIGRVIFSLGVLGMALSSITLQMLCAGFVCVELFGWKVGSWRYHLGTLLPAPGFLGAVFWKEIAVWVAVPTNILCGFFLPAAYVGFILLQRNKSYLKDDTPTGAKGRTWIGAMICSTLFLAVFMVWFAWTKGPSYFHDLFERLG
jgi:Mn2+/Fe2+ NRAMP family transporter